MKMFLAMTAALVAAVAVLVAISLPPARLALTTPFIDGTVPGIIHVHTNRSDGRGTFDEVAAAAARAGLRFVVFTDHGDATRTPETPVYRSGVLCLDAVELSTTEGHYLALDMPAAPYPLAGDPRDVVEDVKRLGGFGIVAHPESPKATLAWEAWDAPFDAIEWVNPDTSWRVRVQQRGWWAKWTLIEALTAYPFRSEEAMARLLGGTTLHRDRWNSLVRARRVVALAGADAHAKLAFGNIDPGDNSPSLPLPGYESSFRTLSVHVQPARPLSGDALTDAAAILKAFRQGHAYVVIDGLASPASFQFTASSVRGTAGQGDELTGDWPVTLRVRSNAPPSFSTVIWQADRVLASIQDQREVTTVVDVPAVYRVEIEAPSNDGPIPWLISNPIYVGVSYPPPPRTAARPISATRVLFDGQTSTGWRTETDSTSLAALDVAPAVTGANLRLRYGLSGGSPSGQYAAVVVTVPAGESYDRLTFTVRSERPLRLSVQLRAEPAGERWQRSVYVDKTDRQYTIDFNDATAIGTARSPRLNPNAVRDVMFVIDTIHAKPGTSGRVWIKNVALEK